MRHGAAVYTEKPPAPSAAEALEVARVSRETGVLCTTAFKKRYSTAYGRAKEWLTGFPVEERLSISIDYASGPYAGADGRHGFLHDFAIHAIDLVRYLFGEVAEVVCFAKARDAYAVSLRFDHGAVGSMNLNDGRSFGVPTEEVEITLAGGSFMTIHNSACWRITQDQKPLEWREPPTFVSAGDSGNDTGHLAEIVDFLAAVREGRSTRSCIYESYRSMVLYEAIRDSAETGQVVRPQYQPLE
jgi:predicted dehydrogenase